MEMVISCFGTCIMFILNLSIFCAALKNRIKLPFIKVCIVLAAGFAGAMAIAFLLAVTQFVLVWNLCYIAAYCALTVIICKILFRCSINECIFLYFIIQSYIDNSFVISKILQSYFLRYFMTDYYSFYLSFGLVVLFSFFIIYKFNKYKLKPLVDTTESMGFWRYIWVIPVSFYLVYRMGISQQYVYLELSWEHTDIIVPILWILATSLSYLMIVSMPLQVVKHVEYKEQLEAANQHLLMQKEHFEKLSSSVEEARQIRHDLRHHMRVIAGYADNENIGELKKYLKQYSESGSQEEDMPLCDNPAIDSMIHYYIQASRQSGILMTIKLDTLRSLPCTDSDISVVLGNLLENALEACQRQKEGKRFIDIKLSAGEQHMVVLMITNSSDTSIAYQGESILSAKRNYSRAGVGLSSVKKIAEKYQGVVAYDHKDNQFTVKVLLMGT